MVVPDGLRDGSINPRHRVEPGEGGGLFLDPQLEPEPEAAGSVVVPAAAAVHSRAIFIRAPDGQTIPLVASSADTIAEIVRGVALALSLSLSLSLSFSLSFSLSL